MNRYARERAALDDGYRDNLCPTCDGAGYLSVTIVAYRDEQHYEMVDCPTCRGDGVLCQPQTEADIMALDHVYNDERRDTP